MDIRDYVRALRRNWIAIILMTAVGLGAAYGWAKIQTPVYEASISGLVQTRPKADVQEQQQLLSQANDAAARAKVPTYLVMAGWRNVGESAAAELKVSDSPDALFKRITVTNPDNTNIIDIAAQGPSPKAASELATAWMNGLVSQIDKTDGINSAPGTSPIMIYLAQTAALPEAPIFPSVPTALLIGGLLGLGGGIAFAMIRAISDRRVRGTDDVEQRLGVPVVGTIPKVDTVVAERRIVNDDDAHSGTRVDFAVRESLRALRTNLQFMDVDHPPRTIVVTSALPGEGKSTVATNLAMTLAAAGAHVVLVDGDLRRPTVASTLGLVSGAGLTDVLSGRAKLTDVLQGAPDAPNLAVLTAGTIPPNPSEVLGSERMHQLVKDLAGHATVIIDAPPLLAVTDGAVLTNQADGALLVVAVGKTTYDVVDKALNALEKARGRVLGVVLNRAPVTGGRASKYSYDYRDPDKAASKRSGRAKRGIAAPAEAAAGPVRAPSAPAEPVRPHSAAPAETPAAPATAKPRRASDPARAIGPDPAPVADPDAGDFDSLLGDFIADDAAGGPRRQRGRS